MNDHHVVDPDGPLPPAMHDAFGRAVGSAGSGGRPLPSPNRPLDFGIAAAIGLHRRGILRMGAANPIRAAAIGGGLKLAHHVIARAAYAIETYAHCHDAKLSDIGTDADTAEWPAYALDRILPPSATELNASFADEGMIVMDYARLHGYPQPYAMGRYG